MEILTISLFSVATCLLQTGLWIPAQSAPHLGELVSEKPMTKVEEMCKLADECIHDTVPVCGFGDPDKRTFLDFCDMMEFACDSNRVFVHIDDTDDCPKA